MFIFCEVQRYVKEVNSLEVTLNSDSKAIALKDLNEFLPELLYFWTWGPAVVEPETIITIEAKGNFFNKD